MVLLSNLFVIFALNMTGHAQQEPLPAFPSYEPEAAALLALFNQDQLAPSYLRAKFSEFTNNKRKEMSEYEKLHRENLSREQKKARDEFNAAEKADIKQWRLQNPKGQFREYYKGLSVKRKAFTDLQVTARRLFETDLRAKRATFNEFMKIRGEEFRKKLSAYSEEQKAKPPVAANPALQEFKDIPRGPGIPLSPAKQ
jgi:hypothetical protein